jgi:ATP-binding cassette subfamily C protein
MDPHERRDGGLEGAPDPALAATGAGTEPGSPARLREMASRYWRAARSERRLAVASVALAAISGVFEGTALLMLVPLLEQTGVGGDEGRFTRLVEMFGFQEREVVWAAVGAFALLSLAAAGTRFAADATMSATRARVEAQLRKQLTRRLLSMEWSAFLLTRFGETASSLMAESSQLSAGVHQFLLLLGSLTVTSLFVVLALVVSVQLTALVLAFALVGLFAVRPLGRHVERYTLRLTSVTGDIARSVLDILGNLKFFRSTGSHRRAEELFSREYDEYARWFQRTESSPYAVRLAYELAALAFVVLVLVVSIHDEGRLSAETLVFLAIFWRLSPRVRDLQEGVVRLRVFFPWLAQWEQRLAVAERHQRRAGGASRPSFESALSFERVSFAFPGASRKIVDGVTWELRPGDSVAFVGESGAGKTTMLDLVTGLLVPTEGRVALDGVSLTNVDVDLWQAHIGLVLQESPLFHATVRDNVVGDHEHDDELVWQSLAAAHADAVARELPAGLDTIVGERGGRLSGGQRQRLGLARALYRRPWLLILDEATSALDSLSESVVLDALRSLRGDLAMMIVAHRLATVELADRIHVLEGGRIVQSGAWTELLSDRDGPFARLAAKQGLLAQTPPA